MTGAVIMPYAARRGLHFPKRAIGIKTVTWIKKTDFGRVVR